MKQKIEGGKVVEWKPGDGDVIYWVGLYPDDYSGTYEVGSGYYFEDCELEIGNVFRTRELATEALKKIEIILKNIKHT